ncbi:MAG: PHP domain-containing protein [Acidobacteria bacterium]|nr:PHP domain-containing protein [Acidobacteriota bacterium]
MIDLHTHSNISDGTDSPAELIHKAQSAGISVLALTDHDTIAGWDSARTALKTGMDLVLGAEISCQAEDGVSVHMLGLLFDSKNLELQEELAKTRDNRLTRMDRIIEKLNAAGIEISIEEVLDQLTEGATLGRPHLADALIAKGHVKNREDAFAALLHNRSKYYVSHYSPTPEAAIRLIKAAGGVAVIAHPYASHRGRVLTAESLRGLVEAGLDGIEIDHRDHSESERASLLRVAYSYDLAITGASDYHGSGKINQLAENTTAVNQWEKLEAKANARRVVRK